jgi:MFS family permease
MVMTAQQALLVVLVALPAIEEDLGLTGAAVHWVEIGFLVPMVALALAAGRWVDTVGLGRVVRGGAAGMGMGAAIAAIAFDPAVLVAGRVLQGTGSAVLLAAAPAVALIAAAPGASGRALGVLATVAPAGAVLGPLYGGWLIDTLGWRSVFVLGVLHSVLVVLLVRSLPPRSVTRRATTRSVVREVTLLAAGFTALLLGVAPGGVTGSHRLALVVTALLVAAAWWWSPPAADVRALLRVRGSMAVHGALAGVYLAVLGLLFVVPFFLVDADASAGAVGMAVAAEPMGAALIGPVAGRLTDRGSSRRLAVCGTAVVAIGAALIAAAPELSTTGAVWRLALVGVGFGLFVTPTQDMVLRLGGPTNVGLATAVSNLARSIGTALGPAAAAAAWSWGDRGTGGLRAAGALAAVAGAASAGALLAFPTTTVRDPVPVPATTKET